MTKSYKKIQYDHQYDVCMSHQEWFGSDSCFGTFRKKTYPFVLRNCMNNLFEELRTKDRKNPQNVLRYFHGASDYIHVHVVPEANTTLRNRVYRKDSWDNGEGMVATWKANLVNPEKYVCIDQRELFAGILEDPELSSKYATLLSYLEERYWK